ncbi:ferredoxin [Mycobacterium sp. B14F4]|uniref:ferredoxin n=1 Tax=Mycobacterium sp. B14F4 TaxID=3153565 RepID=UPI00325F7C4F
MAFPYVRNQHGSSTIASEYLAATAVFALVLLPLAVPVAVTAVHAGRRRGTAGPVLARAVRPAVDHRRKNRSQEHIDLETLMHITVDYTLCEGHGQCLLAAPDVFDLPDDAEQVVLLNPNPPEKYEDAIIRAAAMCPAQALTVVD